MPARSTWRNRCRPHRLRSPGEPGGALCRGRAAGFVLQALMLQVLVAAGLPYLLATALAVEGAILHNFVWHERWTWADRVVTHGAGLKGRHYDVPSRHGRLVRFARFNGATAF